LGWYLSFEIALKTLLLVLLDTFASPFATRDTVVVETPAILATSFALDFMPLRSANAPGNLASRIEELFLSWLPGFALLESIVCSPLAA
jgi:hypothetical protein